MEFDWQANDGPTLNAGSVFQRLWCPPLDPPVHPYFVCASDEGTNRCWYMIYVPNSHVQIQMVKMVQVQMLIWFSRILKEINHALIKRDEGEGPDPPPEKLQNIWFLINTGPDPLKNHKAKKPAINVGPPLARE